MARAPARSAHSASMARARASASGAATTPVVPATTNSSGPEESVLRKEQAADLDVALDALAVFVEFAQPFSLLFRVAQNADVDRG